MIYAHTYGHLSIPAAMAGLENLSGRFCPRPTSGSLWTAWKFVDCDQNFGLGQCGVLI
jgi:hypothetical protein